MIFTRKWGFIQTSAESHFESRVHLLGNAYPSSGTRKAIEEKHEKNCP